jgi:anion-transporting  ArsA/GET3 family ATPase
VKSQSKLYLFTGKGGVGKTTLSLAFTRYLREQGVNAQWITFSQVSFDQSHLDQTHKEWNFPQIKLEIETSAEGYIAKKLGSSLVAKWVTKTSFFRALVNMIPGFSYVILLGKMLDMIKNSEEPLTLVLDAPASGHALAMLEATGNFQEIFQAGALFDDTKKMLDQLHSPDFLNIFIVTLPTELSLHESQELTDHIKKLGFSGSDLVLNYSLQSFENEFKDAPDILKSKLEHEKQLITENVQTFKSRFDYSSARDANKVYQDLLHGLRKLS